MDLKQWAVGWIKLAHDRVHRKAVVNKVSIKTGLVDCQLVNKDGLYSCGALPCPGMSQGHRHGDDKCVDDSCRIINLILRTWQEIICTTFRRP